MRQWDEDVIVRPVLLADFTIFIKRITPQVE
jgi:hypothetical protein